MTKRIGRMNDDASKTGGSPLSRLGLAISLLVGLGVFALSVWLAVGVIASAALAIAGSAVVAYVVWPRLFRMRC